MKYCYGLALAGLLLGGCWNEAETFLTATNNCREEMYRGCRACLDRQGEIVINYESSKFYAMCMERQGYTMGIAEAQRCLQSPSLDCYGVGDKVSWFWDKYTSRVSESINHIRNQ